MVAATTVAAFGPVPPHPTVEIRELDDPELGGEYVTVGFALNGFVFSVSLDDTATIRDIGAAFYDAATALDNARANILRGVGK